MADKQQMQVPGDAVAAAEEGWRGAEGATGAGESGGGAYPNPHEPGEGTPHDGFTGHGGQTEIAYHGSGRLGHQSAEAAPPPDAADRSR